MLTVDATTLNSDADDCLITCLEQENATVTVYAPTVNSITAGSQVSVSTSDLNLPKLTITLAKGATLSMQNNEYGTVRLVKQTTGSTVVELEGLTPANTENWLDINDGRMTIGNAHDVRLDLPTCDNGENDLRLTTKPDSLTVNGQVMNIQQLQENPGNSCVRIAF
jgi:hypothetical protein